MARYSLVQLDTIYFTGDGTEDGKPCRVIIGGLQYLLPNKGGQTIISANGTPWTQVVNLSRRGLRLDLIVDFIEKTLHETILALINDMIDNEEQCPLNITGDAGDFSLTVKPFVPDSVTTTGEFSGGILKNVTYSFITT